MSSIAGFLSEFFGDGNALNAKNPHVATLTEQAESEWPDVPIALPRTGDERAPDLVRWYVLSPARSEDARLAEELGAWIGPTYCATWTSQPAQLDTRDPIDRAAAELAEGAVFLVDIAAEDRVAVREKLTQLRMLWQERPEERARIPLRTSELLRDLRLSLTNGNPQTARAILEEVERRGLISSENELFLQIAVLEVEGRWPEITKHPRLPDLAARRRPWSVTRGLLRAIYRAQFVDVEESADLAHWIDRAAEIELELPGLFSTRGPLDAPEVAKLFALIDRGHPERPYRTRARVLEAPGLSEADMAFLESVLDPAEPEAPDNPLEEARNLTAARDYDPAWDLALSLQGGPERTALLIECAVELGTASAARVALEVLHDLDEADSADLLQSTRLSRDVRDLKASLVSPEADAAGADSAESWEEWFQALHTSEQWPAAASVAEMGASEWSGENLLSGNGSELAALIQHSRTAEQERTFLESAATLLDWLGRLEPNAAVMRVEMAFLEAVCLGDLRSDVALETALAIAESIIESGIDEDEYAEVMSNVEAVWDAHVSPRLLPWLTDCFELLGDLPRHEKELEAAAAAMLAAASPAIIRVDAFSVGELSEAAEQIGLVSGTIPKAQGTSAAKVWGEIGRSGEHIGLYTLSPHVGERVKRKLESLIPGVVVTVNSDKKSTDKLRSLAKSADHMIVMLGSATHAATDAIAAMRPESASTLRVGCRGSSGVLAAFRDHLMAC